VQRVGQEPATNQEQAPWKRGPQRQDSLTASSIEIGRNGHVLDSGAQRSAAQQADSAGEAAQVVPRDALLTLC
jgi:hypothetical protein